MKLHQNTPIEFAAGAKVSLLDLGDTPRIAGYLVPYGRIDNPLLDDTDGEFFDNRTAKVDEFYKFLGKLPALVHHDRFEDIFKTANIAVPEGIKLDGPVGPIYKFEKQAKGWWAEAALQAVNAEQEDYIKFLLELVENQRLAWSSGALPQRVRKSDQRHIAEWKVIEGSLTPTPANFHNSGVITLTIKSITPHLKTLGIDLPVQDEGEEPTSVEKTTGEDAESDSAGDTTKRMSWDERVQSIRNAFNQQFNDPQGAMNNYHVWASRVYDDELYVEDNDSFTYRVRYMGNDDKGYMFAPKEQWIRGRMEFIPDVDDKSSEDMSQDDVPQTTKTNAIAVQATLWLAQKRLDLS